MAKIFKRTEAKSSPDLRRVLALPKREWSAWELERLRDTYTDACKVPGATMRLHAIQAQALHEIKETGGLLGPIAVGGGKTLISLLAPLVVQARRPLLILPAFLVSKTERERGTLSKSFRIPRNVQIVSYEFLGRENAEKFLSDTVKPDLIICDEAHRLKNAKAGVTRRISRYLEANKSCKFVCMSGTLIKDGIQDFAQLSAWALGDGSPCPLDENTLLDWESALAPQHKNPLREVDPGPMLALASEEDIREKGEREAVRLGFQRRLLATNGVVASRDGSLGTALYVRALEYGVNGATIANFETLRRLWETPDGWALTMAADIARHAYELALGLHYVWDPRPPVEWLEARKQWAKFVRDVISESETLDTEKTVATACERGLLRDTEFRIWANIRKTFTPKTRAVWHDNAPMEFVEKWAKEGPGIIWVRHTLFAKRLSQLTGLAYYGADGVTESGDFIEDASGKQCIIASAKANGTGRNLQKWSRNLHTAWQPSALEAEQLIGRTHRFGQDADAIYMDCLVGCAEHLNAMRSCVATATANEQTMGHAQKLLRATFSTSWEDLAAKEQGSDVRWKKLPTPQ